MPDVLALLKRIEHAGEDGQCMECRHFTSHEPDCELAQAIRDLGGEPYESPPSTYERPTGISIEPVFSRDALVIVRRGDDE